LPWNGDFAAGVSAIDDALTMRVPKDFVVCIAQTTTFYLRPEFFWNAEDVFRGIGLSGRDARGVVERLTVLLEEALEVAVYVKDDDAVATDAGEDTYGFEVWVALDREGNVRRSELVVKGVFEGIFAGSRATGFHASPFGVDGGVDESLREAVDELFEVHVVFETSRTHPGRPIHRRAFPGSFLY
tara:strand:- start:111 stop:665 length:555 start_codon:yes stop_codon:yes gene_type:complete